MHAQSRSKLFRRQISRFLRSDASVVILFNISKRYWWYDVFFEETVILKLSAFFSLSWIHRCRGCTVVVDTPLSWIHRCRGYTVVVDTPLSWMHRCRGCTVVVDTPLSWIHRCSDSSHLKYTVHNYATHFRQLIYKQNVILIKCMLSKQLY